MIELLGPGSATMAHHKSRRVLAGAKYWQGTINENVRCGHFLFMLLLVPSLSSVFHSCAARRSSQQTDINDMQDLMNFKKFADPAANKLTSWTMISDPCVGTFKWHGIVCNNSRVSSVVLNGTGLSGTFANGTLGKLTELNILDLSNNNFTGSIPDDLANLTSLAQLSMQDANFSGLFPNFFTSTRLVNLGKLDLSGNHLLGPIPDLSGLISLTILDLSRNNFNSTIPSLPPRLVTLDLSDNQLSGSIPLELVSSLGGNLSIGGNAALCGPPTSNPCTSSSSAGTSEPSLSSSSPTTQAPASAPGTPTQHHRNTKAIRVLVIVVVDAVGVLVIICGILVFLCKRYPNLGKKLLAPKDDTPKKLLDKPPPPAAAAEGVITVPKKAELTFVEEAPHKFDLEDLFRASAEILGRGSLGTTYKARLGNGKVVAVKRLNNVKEMDELQFEKQMGVLGRLNHPHLLPLRAYYFAEEEKLLVYDYMDNGSLASTLHRHKGVEGHQPLDWDSRLKIAYDVAVGLSFLHEQCPSKMVPHQNLKASNILLGNNYEAYIADYCLISLMPPKIAAKGMTGYAAPEYNRTRKKSRKADIYSFGVLLLELLTGQKPALASGDDGIDLPKFVKSESVKEEWSVEVFDLQLKTSADGDAEMLTVLQIAMRCVEDNPDRRPPLSEVLAVLESMISVRQGKHYFQDSSFQTQSQFSEVIDRSEESDSRDFVGDSDASISR